MPIFQSIPGLNGLMDVNKKEMLLNKIMSNIYSNGSIEKQLTLSKRWVSKSKKCISIPVFASPCQFLKLLVGTYISKKEMCYLIKECPIFTQMVLWRKSWLSQNFGFSSVKNASPYQFLASSNSRRYHWILKFLVAT